MSRPSLRIDDLAAFRRQKPDWQFSDILKARACETYLRRGEIDPLITTLIPLAEEFEAHHSSALKHHPLAWMKALANMHGNGRAIARKYSPDQPRVPTGSPDGGQWTSGEGGGSGSATSGLDQLASNTNSFGTLIAELPRTDF